MPPDILAPWEDFIFSCFSEYRLEVPGGVIPERLWKEKMRLWHDRWHSAHAPKHRTAFVPPTPQEVTAYSQEIGWPLDGVAFCLHYETKRWCTSGNSKVRDWRKCVEKWKHDKIKTKFTPERSPDLLSSRALTEPPGWFAFMCREYADSIYVRQWTEDGAREAPKWAGLQTDVKKTVLELMAKKEHQAAHPVLTD